MKILRLKNNLTVVMEDGDTYSVNNCTDELYERLLGLNKEGVENLKETVRELLFPDLVIKKQEIKEQEDVLDKVSNSHFLTRKGDSIYITSICELTVPLELVKAFVKAEEEKNQELIQTYLNFWTLCSQNPDSRARANLFWFLQKYGMKISKSGLFVAYRNVLVLREGKDVNLDMTKFITESYMHIRHKLKKSARDYFVGLDQTGLMTCTKKQSDLSEIKGNVFDLYHSLKEGGEEESKKTTVFTDAYSRNFEIRIGDVVTMPREQCDFIQENTCSRGLHVAGKSWLETNKSFGNVGLKVLVNPADVVAVPPVDSYGKMRTCAYYPIQVVEWSEDDLIVDEDVPDGFEDDFMDKILYTGKVNEVDGGNYSMQILILPEVNKERILARLEDIKRNLKSKIVS